jgi:hypothetical protein
VPHRNNVAPIVVNETAKGPDIASQIAMPQQHRLGTVEIFDATANLDSELRFDRLLPAGQADAPGKKAKISVGLRQRKPRERLSKESQVEQSSVEGDQGRSPAK